MHFPVDDILPELFEAFRSSQTVLLSAPPGAGKTTRVPPALLNSGSAGNRKILMLEPRRLAAKRSAEFMAQQLGESVGRTIGYRIRGENRVSPDTRIEVLTEGILTRMLHDQPDLTEAAIVIFDEFHERSIHADLSLAFALDVQQHLRPDLKILIMSATLDVEHLSEQLQAPIVRSDGRIFPVETRFARFISDKHIEPRTADNILRALETDEGDILVFLSGWREIQRTKQLLEEQLHRDDVGIHLLHGELSSSEQRTALDPAPIGKRKVILSTNVAETSVTIEGVRIVVDSGFMRSARFDARRGMSGLVTTRISKASADQRRGRAGRTQSGACYRLWTEEEHAQLPDFTQPEIKEADLLPLALDLIRWGSPIGEGLFFVDPPPESNLRQAHTLLKNLEAIDSKFKATPLGLSMSELPVHPRLAHMILRGASIHQQSEACLLAAMLEERDVLTGRSDSDVDVSKRWNEVIQSNHPSILRIRHQASRLRHILKISDEMSAQPRLGLLLAFAYPDRIGRKKGDESGLYQLTNGSTASLPKGGTFASEEFLCISDADYQGNIARIRMAAPLSKRDLIEHFVHLLIEEDEVRWNVSKEEVLARRVTRLDSLIIEERLIHQFDDRMSTAMVDGIRTMGLRSLPWSKQSESLCRRVEWITRHGHRTSELPDFSENGLLASLDSWLAPFLTGIRQRSQLSRLDLLMILESRLSYQQKQLLDRLAPTHLTVPSGSSIPLDYSGDVPVLAVRLQEIFGLTRSPVVGSNSIPVLIHILSPAKRPLAVTQDLSSFWENTYPQIRGQMRADYPKHLWPENPLEAIPTNKTRRQFERNGP